MAVMKKTSVNCGAYLSKDNTDSLKGVLAILVLACHLRGQLSCLNDTIVGQILTVSGYLAVSVFLFLSGYGLQTSYEKKGNEYIAGFQKQRILPFYCTYLFAVFIWFMMHF